MDTDLVAFLDTKEEAMLGLQKRSCKVEWLEILHRRQSH
jgi:hypothetical protein